MSKNNNHSRELPGGYFKTPMYTVRNSDRYARQGIIKKIQDESNRRLICYVSGIRCMITSDDIIPFHDLLRNVSEGTNLDLLLHTPGGDIDSAEKIISMIRDCLGPGSFRIIVPDFAKSAGALMVMGADRVLMSDSSELGPIDPQVEYADAGGKYSWISVQHYLKAYDECIKKLSKSPSDVAAQVMVEKMDPVLHRQCELINKRAQKLAEDLLRKGMFLRNGGPWTKTASALINTDKWMTHEHFISRRVAEGPELELVVDYLEPNSDQWQLYWELYCRQRVAIGDDQKLFESDIVSLSGMDFDWPDDRDNQND